MRTSHPQPPPSKALCEFLINQIGISKEALELGKKQSKLENAPLPIVLWSFGLINLDQYQCILDWRRSN